ncbi:hypothetical protein [Streptosporangium sp. NPDC087985]|uniref:hypothetical protein n=1 Tax=Streptosporangium sp. NPDC087985 TaxID=3366196 RepID=UPI00381ED2C8
MSNTSRNIRGLLAVAALAAGVSWMAAAPASASTMLCQVLDSAETPKSVAAVCDTEVSAHGEAPATEENSRRPVLDGVLPDLRLN